MTSAYPGALDSLSNPSSSDAMNSGAGHAAQHANANDAIEAIQAELGTDPAGASSTVKDRLDALAFAGLADVDMSGVSDGEVPTWDAGSSKFVPGTGGGGGGGGLVLVDSGTFSAVASVSLPNGSFDSTYDDYLLVVRCAHSTGTQLLGRLRASGTDDTGTHYLTQRMFGYGTTGGTDQNAVGSGAAFFLNSGGTHRAHTRLELFSPAVAEPTGGLVQAVCYVPGVSNWNWQGAGLNHDQSTAYDSLTFYPPAGDITGRWELYGYAKDTPSGGGSSVGGDLYLSTIYT